jgi:hypothetical protein
MNLKFNPEAKCTEWSNGPKYFKNEGQPLEVAPALGRQMLKQMHEVQPRQFVPVFVEVEAEAKAPKKAEKAEKAEDKA